MAFGHATNLRFSFFSYQVLQLEDSEIPPARLALPEVCGGSGWHEARLAALSHLLLHTPELLLERAQPRHDCRGCTRGTGFIRSLNAYISAKSRTAF